MGRALDGTLRFSSMETKSCPFEKVVVEQVEREGKRAWREEVEGRQDLGNYKDRQLVLERADYIANSSGDKIRAEIKGKCEWGSIFEI